MLRLQGIGKTYAAPVLSDVDLALTPGRGHALLGANGAGKSTLAKIISGLISAASGTMTLDGVPYRPADKAEAEKRGVHIVQQELNLIEELSVAENLFLNRLPRLGGWRLGWIDYDRLHQEAAEALALVDLNDVDPRLPVARLGVGRRQLVEIASALSRECRWLILDEPTAALNGPQIDRLFEHVDRLKAAGAGVVYISHRMEEIERVCDRVAVLRDGRLVACRDAEDLPLAEAVRLMTGAEEAPAQTKGLRSASKPKPLLRVEKLTRGKLVRAVSFEARSGEVLGIAGLVGSGRTELLRAIFGADVADSGSVFVDGMEAPRLFRSPSEAVQAGIAMTPEDRKEDGLLLSKSIRFNVTLAQLRPGSGVSWLRRGWVHAAGEREAARRASDETEIRSRSVEQLVGELSGGNQQKALMARWLMCDAKVYLFDEPTRGVDVAAKAAIHHLLGRLAEQGKAVVAVSSDLAELISLCDRILVMTRGRLTTPIDRGEWTEQRLLTAALAAEESD